MSNNIIQGGPIPKKDYYKVYVRSCTYNQSQYIEDCLNGVALQKTDFPFVHHVIDDCSTDGEQEVIKAWIERECDLETAEYYDNDICTITLAKNKSNFNYTLVAYFLKRNMYREREEKEKLYAPWREVCPYEAICEGDDYWIASDKINTQINFLDKNPDHGLTWGKALVYNTSSNMFDGEVGRDSSAYESLLLKNEVVTLTAVFRIKSLVGYKNFIGSSRWLMGDYPMWLYISMHYKIKDFDTIFGVYRVLKNSASLRFSYSSRLKFLCSATECRKYFARKTCPVMLELIEQNSIMELFNLSYNEKMYRNAIVYYKKMEKHTIKLFIKRWYSAISLYICR